MISEGLTKPIVKEDILSPEIKVSHLKRIDQVFEKGLHFYLDPKSPEVSKEASIFFRKETFNTTLNIGAKKIVSHFEEFKISLSAIAKLTNLKFRRRINVFKIKDSPKDAAATVRRMVYPDFTSDKREFLKGLITKFAGANILVFEFVETWNKRDKANIDGFFLNPNVIVVKRNQQGMRREIFTLAHELGHYLLNEEEIEDFDYNKILQDRLSNVERWCNDFAYYFLAGSYAKVIDDLHFANSSNDYYDEQIEEVTSRTHLSKLALYTRLLYQKKISSVNYSKIKTEIEARIKVRFEEEKRIRELEASTSDKQAGSVPRPINSPLLISTIQAAFYEGVIDEYEVCKTLNIKPQHLDDFIQ